LSAQAQELKGMLGAFNLNGRRSERKLLTRKFLKDPQTAHLKSGKADPRKRRMKDELYGRGAIPEAIIPLEDDEAESDFEDF
jgi:hypothetical protein